MPGCDGTGPLGQGRRTGGGFGLCGTGARVGNAEVSRGVGRGGFLRGGGRGGCYGGPEIAGRGYGFRDRACRWDEKTVLSNRATALERELAATRERITSIEKDAIQNQ